MFWLFCNFGNYRLRRYSLKATALFKCDSLEPKRKVTESCFLISSISFCTVVLFSSSSLKYLLLNSSHLAGSWLNHFLNSVEGAISFSQRSILAFALESPRGQILSTSIRKPSFCSGWRYALLILIFMVIVFFKEIVVEILCHFFKGRTIFFREAWDGLFF